jgi:hypothetical protein
MGFFRPPMEEVSLASKSVIAKAPNEEVMP